MFRNVVAKVSNTCAVIQVTADGRDINARYRGRRNDRQRPIKMGQNRAFARFAQPADQWRNTHCADPFHAVRVDRFHLPPPENQRIGIRVIVNALTFRAVAAKSHLWHHCNVHLRMAAAAVGQNSGHGDTIGQPQAPVNKGRPQGNRVPRTGIFEPWAPVPHHKGVPAPIAGGPGQSANATALAAGGASCSGVVWSAADRSSFRMAAGFDVRFRSVTVRPERSKYRNRTASPAYPQAAM